MTSSASSAGLSSDHRHPEQDLAGFETTQDLTSTGQSASSSAGPQVNAAAYISQIYRTIIPYTWRFAQNRMPERLLGPSPEKPVAVVVMPV